MEYCNAPAGKAGEEQAQGASSERGGSRFFSARNIAYFGVLTALEVVLLLWGSAIPVGASGAMLNFSLVPIVLGAMLMGPLAGALLGFLSGAVILIMVAAGAQGVFSLLFLEEPFMIALICLVKTTAAGLVSGLFYRALAKKHHGAAVVAAALAAPVVNTAVFILGCLCIGGAIEAWWLSETAQSAAALGIIVLTFVGFNFFIEFAINLILAPALNVVIRVAERRFAGKKKA